MPKVDLSNYETRKQAYIKHCLPEEYLPDWAYKVGSTWTELVYVDGFAGPWQTTHEDYADTSFGVAVQALRQCQAGLKERGRDLPIQCILIDEDKKAFAQLKRFAEVQSNPGFGVHALHGEFVEKIHVVEALIKGTTRNAFRFIFLDPKGWADIPMKRLQPFLRSRSSEVLINLMTRHIIRFLMNRIERVVTTIYSDEPKFWKSCGTHIQRTSPHMLERKKLFVNMRLA